MATTETHDIVIRWQQQGQQAIAAEAKSIQTSFAGIPASITKSFASAAASIKKSLATASASAKQTGAVMSAAVSAPLLLMAKNAIGAASDLNESMSAVQTVFGASSDEVIRFSENAATALGTSQQQALSAASALGALFQSIGLTNTQMADFTINLEQASADLGSFFNQDPSAVLDALKRVARNFDNDQQRLAVGKGLVEIPLCQARRLAHRLHRGVAVAELAIGPDGPLDQPFAPGQPALVG
jgi:hypothetical protein